MRNRIYSPITLNQLAKAKGNFEEAYKVLTTKTGMNIYDDEKAILKAVLGNSFAEKLINLCLNYQDISLSINKSPVLDKDSVEFWTQNLLNTVKQLFSKYIETNEIDDLYVEIFQGRKKEYYYFMYHLIYMLIKMKF